MNSKAKNISVATSLITKSILNCIASMFIEQIAEHCCSDSIVMTQLLYNYITFVELTFAKKKFTNYKTVVDLHP